MKYWSVWVFFFSWLCSFLPKHKGKSFFIKISYGEAYLNACLYFKMYFRVLMSMVWYKWAQSISKSERLMCDRRCFYFFRVVSYNLTKEEEICQFPCGGDGRMGAGWGQT